MFNSNTQASWNVQTVALSNNQSYEFMVADGELEGNSSMIIKVPEEQIMIVMLNNTGVGYREKAEFGLKVLRVLLEQ